MKYIHIIYTLFACITFSCSNPVKPDINSSETKTYTELEKTAWFIGVWQNISPEGNACEIWERENDSTFSGQSFFIIGNDTVSHEKLRLHQSGPDLFYIPTVQNQNDGKPVHFRLTSGDEKNLVFENPGHDFPQKISYTQIHKDSMLAEISGMKDGKPDTMQFPMSRKF